MHVQKLTGSPAGRAVGRSGVDSVQAVADEAGVSVLDAVLLGPGGVGGLFTLDDGVAYGLGVSPSLIFLSGRARLGNFSWGPGRGRELSLLRSRRGTRPSTNFQFAQIPSCSMSVPHILFF